MTTFVVPGPDARPWPTLGPQVVDAIEAGLAFGPGDLRGEPARVDAETRAFIYRAYEVHPYPGWPRAKPPKASPRAGRRRFKRVALSLRKGTAKTEKAAWIGAVELHPEGPVRCDGWRKVAGVWEPVGRGVRDPYIPMVAYTEEQTEELAYGALMVVLGEGPWADDFDIGLERVVRADGTGKAVPLANAPSARDGARTTFQHFDETHRFIREALRQAHTTMLANIPKRPMADPWSLETTTMYAPGQGSVAEATHDTARHIATGAVKDPRLFYFHRQASEHHDLTTDAGLRAAVLEAGGPYAEWSDNDSIAETIRSSPPRDQPYNIRVWLNRPMRDAQHAFEVERWKQLAKPGRRIRSGALITLGFDGSRTRDGTALVATHVRSGFQWVVGVWERPPGVPRWEVPADQVNLKLAEAFRDYDVWRLYGDPAYWETQLSEWAGRYGEERVVKWWTLRDLPMAKACRAYADALNGGELSHPGDDRFTAHIGNSRRRYIPTLDDHGERMWVITKERPDSEHHIDVAAAAVLSWEARLDAIASGLAMPARRSVYEERGVITVGGLS